MCIMSVGDSLVKNSKGVIQEERAVIADIYHIAMHGRDIAHLIASSCLPSSKVPLERVVSKLLITASNAIQSLGNLTYQGHDEHEFQHTYRTIRSSPLKAIQDDIFAREVDRGTHSGKIAAEVSGALQLIKGQYHKNGDMIFSALGEFVKKQEEDLSSLLQLPLNLKKLNQIDREIHNLLYAIEVLAPSNREVDCTESSPCEDLPDLIRKRLDGILKYIELTQLVAEIETFNPSSEVDFQQFFWIANTFELTLYDWMKNSQAIAKKHEGSDYLFYTNGLTFAENLRGLCADKFLSFFSVFTPIVENMKQLAERKFQAEFSQNGAALQEDMVALDSKASDCEIILGEAHNFLTRFSGPDSKPEKQFINIARDIKRHLMDPLKQLKRELRDSFDLDSSESLIDLKKELVKVATNHKGFKEAYVKVEGAGEVVALCEFLQRASENLVGIIDEKLTQVVNEEILEKKSEMESFFEDEVKGQTWQKKMAKFCDGLTKMRRDKLSSFLPEALQTQRHAELRKLYWISSFTIHENENPLTRKELVSSVNRLKELFQMYHAEIKKIGAIDPELDSWIRDSYSGRINMLSQEILRSATQGIHRYAEKAERYSRMAISRNLAEEISALLKEYKRHKEEASLDLEVLDDRKDPLNTQMYYVQTLFSLMILEYNFPTYAENPEKYLSKFLIKQKYFYKIQGEFSKEQFSSKYQALVGEKLKVLGSFIRDQEENYQGIFTGSIMAFSDELDSWSVLPEAERIGLLKDIHGRIELLDEQYEVFISQCPSRMSELDETRSFIKNLRVKFNHVSLQVVSGLLKSLEDSIMSELSTSSKKEESFYIEKIETFYSEFITLHLLKEVEGSVVAIDLLKEKDIILGKIRSIFEGELMGSPDRVLFSPAFASFGMFNNEYERNDLFMKIIKKLK